MGNGSNGKCYDRTCVTKCGMLSSKRLQSALNIVGYVAGRTCYDLQNNRAKTL